jgi:hypothetical protein
MLSQIISPLVALRMVAVIALAFPFWGIAQVPPGCPLIPRHLGGCKPLEKHTDSTAAREAMKERRVPQGCGKGMKWVETSAMCEGLPEINTNSGGAEIISFYRPESVKDADEFTISWNCPDSSRTVRVVAELESGPTESRFVSCSAKHFSWPAIVPKDPTNRGNEAIYARVELADLADCEPAVLLFAILRIPSALIDSKTPRLRAIDAPSTESVRIAIKTFDQSAGGWLIQMGGSKPVHDPSKALRARELSLGRPKDCVPVSIRIGPSGSGEVSWIADLVF